MYIRIRHPSLLQSLMLTQLGLLTYLILVSPSLGPIAAHLTGKEPFTYDAGALGNGWNRQKWAW